jgi:uncharacterized phage-associated protein
MENSIAVANWFIKKANEVGAEITPMKLVKLTYIAHGWHLAMKDGKELLGEPVQAWQYGPVVPSVYHAFKDCGSNQVTVPLFPDTIKLIDTSEEEFLNEVWTAYGKYTGLQLSTLTHQPNTPWSVVWNQLNGKNRSSAIIPNDLIKKHYLAKMQSSVVA